MQRVTRLILAAAFTLSAQQVFAASFTSDSGPAYGTNSTGTWLGVAGPDSIGVDTLLAVVRIPPDSTLTEAKLTAAGFPYSDIVRELYGNYYAITGNLPPFSGPFSL